MVKADDIFLFVQVVDEGSFSRVAERCGLTNSVVSKRIGRLEKALNVQLLYRTTRKLSLTDAGRALYGKARLAQEALQDAQDAVTGYGDTIRGKIRITAPAVSSGLVLSEAIAEFCQRYPDVEIELVVSNHFYDLIDDGFDLAIRTAVLEDSSLIARRLIDSHWMTCASAAYFSKAPALTHPDDLSNHHCLLYKNDATAQAAWQFRQGDSSYSVLVNGRFRTNNLDSLRKAAEAGLGIAYLPRALVHESLLSGKLVTVLDDFVDKALGIYAVYPRTRQPDKKLNLLVEHFRQAFQAKKAWFF